MGIAQFIVVSTNPLRGNESTSTFFDSYEVAVEHARRVSRDLGKDCYVARIEATMYGDRSQPLATPENLTFMTAREKPSAFR
jgi:hypothetical protein